jgi:hypothetical protein
MAILIKNPGVEARARELAALTGETLTGAIDEAVKRRPAIEQERRRPRKKGHARRDDRGHRPVSQSGRPRQGLDIPLLYEGDDFARTDIRSALQPM